MRRQRPLPRSVRWPVPPPVVLLALLLGASATVLGGCDGGISGTGIPPVDANGSNAPVDGTGESGQQAPGESPMDGEGADGFPDGESDGNGGNVGAGQDGDASTDADPRQLANARAVREGVPGVRLVNVSGEPLAVTAGPDRIVLVARLAPSDGDGRTLSAVEFSGSGDDATGAEARLQAPLRVVSTDDAAPFALFEPLALVDGSVTTLLVRPRGGTATAVIALETDVAPADPTLARVRIVTALPGGMPDQAIELAHGGDGTDRQLGMIDAARPASDYLSVPPGEYRARAADGTVFDGSLNLIAGDVVTGVLIAADGREAVPRLLTLFDGRAGR